MILTKNTTTLYHQFRELQTKLHLMVNYTFINNFSDKERVTTR